MLRDLVMGKLRRGASYASRTMPALLATLGCASLALANTDLSGNWVSLSHEDQQVRGEGPNPVDFLGVPLSPEGRARALAYRDAIADMPERQCQYYGASYLTIGPQSLKIWPQLDRLTGGVVAWHIGGVVDRSPVIIWMDGRLHPGPDAVHTSSGFTTGKWDGNKLETVTTHMKPTLLWRNGIPSGDEMTVYSYFTRYADILTIAQYDVDPVYLAEPLVISRSWRFDPHRELPATSALCNPNVEDSPRYPLDAPNYLPSENPQLNFVPQHFHIPLEAALGEDKTLYPEYRQVMKKTYTSPPKCTYYCGVVR